MDPINEEIKRRADIIEVIGQYVALRPAGRDRFKACCPFHDEKTPSFNVSRERGFYKCFGCGKSGDVFKFLQEIDNLSFPEAKRQLAERYGVTLPRSGKELTPEQQAQYEERDRLLKITAAAAAFFREQFAGNKGMPARDYARQRGLSPNILEKFGIGYAPDTWDSLRRHLANRYGFTASDACAAGLLVEKEGADSRAASYYDRYRHRLIFPIWDAQGRVIAFGGRALEGGETGTPDAKYINSPEGRLFNKSATLYAWHLARTEVGKADSVIVTEGYMDAIALHEAGFANTIATLGTSLTTQHVAALARLAPKIVYLCYDGDGAGMRAALRSAPLFASHDLNVHVVVMPDGDDPDTFVKKHGAVSFANALRAARMLAAFRLEKAIEGFDLSNVAARMEAVKAGAGVIAEIQNDIEKDDSIAWLADRWAAAEGVATATRLQLIQAAVRRQVSSALKQQRQYYQPTQSRYSDDENTEINATLSASNGTLSGVVKAERLLLATIMANPSWRLHIMRQLPPDRWTDELHREIALVLNGDDLGELIDATSLVDQLSPSAGNLIGELIVSDDACETTTELVINDCIARVERHWADQVERETLESIQLKIARSEPVSEAEKTACNNALLATGRKTRTPIEN